MTSHGHRHHQHQRHRKDKGRCSGSSSSDGFDSDSSADEVAEIKRAMRDANVRKTSLVRRMKCQIERDNSEKQEYEEVLRSAMGEVESLKKRLNQTEFDLKEAKFELAQSVKKVDLLQSDKNATETALQNRLQDLQQQLTTAKKQHDDHSLFIALESDKVCKILDNFLATAQLHSSDVMSKTNRHLLRKAIACLDRIKSSTAGSGSNYADLRSQAPVTDREVLNVDTAVDAVMLEMCKSLEDENVALSSSVQTLKDQLAEAKREASASQLIPHYRLAILRSRTYAANLLEQVQREQATSQSLREQLDETYSDLKKVIEEKKRLYKKLSKTQLRSEEGEYLALIKSPSLSHSQEHCSSNSHGHRVQRNPTARDLREDNVCRSTPPKNTSRSPLSTDLSSSPVESHLKSELQVLDDQIEMLKGKLGHVALLQSQKILTDVIDSSLSQISPQ